MEALDPDALSLPLQCIVQWVIGRDAVHRCKLLVQQRRHAATVERQALPADLVAHLDAVERDIIVRALVLHRFNRTAAGSSLGLSLRQMRYRMARLGIQVAEHGAE